MKKRTFIIFLIVFLITFYVYSQKEVYSQMEWSLDQCINFANENNLTNKGNQYNSAIKKENFQQSKREFLPSINANSGYSKNFGRYTDSNTNDIINIESYSNNYSIGASLNLFNGFRQWNSVSQKRILFEASQAYLLNEKYKLAFQVMDAFFDVKYKEGFLQVAKEREELSFLNYKMISSKVKLGLLAKSDLYEMESNIATEKLKIIQAENQLEEALLGLMQTMNLKGVSIKLKIELEKENEMNEQIAMSVQETFEKAVKFLPSIKNHKLSLNAVEKSLAITKSALYPSFSINAGLGTGFYETKVDLVGNTIPFFNQLNENMSKYIGVSVRIPIMNKWSVMSRIKIAKIDVLYMTNNLEQKKQEVFKEIQKVLQKKESLLAEKKGNELNLKAKEHAFLIAQKKFTKGISGIYELQQAKNYLTFARIEKIRIELQLRYQNKTIDFYRGISVFQFN